MDQDVIVILSILGVIVGIVVGICIMAAIFKLFSISKVLVEIRDELRKSPAQNVTPEKAQWAESVLAGK